MRAIINGWTLVALIVQLFHGPIIYGQEVELLDVYPSDAQAFTQGLEVTSEGQLLMGTGLYGESHLGYIDLASGKLQTKVSLGEEYFGEGITIKGDTIWQLTWQEEEVFVYRLADFQPVTSFTYEGEGWGLAYDEERDIFWMTDGSHLLQKRDSETFALLEEIAVETKDGQAVDQLNEIEFANGSIYANRWYENEIIQISPSGQILARYDLTQILRDLPLTKQERQQMDSLNGIAHIEGDRFYVTGKFYPVMLEVTLTNN